ncbi:MAG TPA: VWA domain-containing protein [Pyrinomonadaceae bacterium]
MRKFVPCVLLLSLCLFFASSLSAQTRPRRVTQPAVSEPQPNDAPAEAAPSSAPRRPPVLTGTRNSDGTNQPQPAKTDDGPEEVGEGDVVRVETALVSIPVSVMDRDGKYIPDLRQEDFRIFEDGVEQKVAYFASVEKPFTVALVIDVSDSTRFRLDEIQDAAIAFVDQLRPDDRVMVVSFDEKVHVLAEPTNDRYALRNAIRRTSTGGGTSLYDAVDYVINQRFNRIEGRKAIVLFTDGVDTTSKRATYESNIRDAEELDALIYPVQYDTYQPMNNSGGRRGGGRGGRSSGTVADILIGILGGGNVNIGGGGGGGRGTSRADYDRADRYLGDLAQRTGARRYRAESTRNLEESFALIAEELRRQYSLGYYPETVAQVGQRRQIKVRVNRPNLIVKSRDSYISTDANANTQPPQPPNGRRGQLQATRSGKAFPLSQF